MDFDEWIASLSYRQLRFIATEQRGQYSFEELDKIAQEIQKRESQMAAKDQKRFNKARQEEFHGIKEQKKREEERILKYEEQLKKTQEQKRAARAAAPPLVRCPYCNSTDTTKLTATSKAVSFAVWGLFSDKRGKQWKCNACKSLF